MSNRSRKTFACLVAAFLVALGWITWPYYALYDFANAIQQADEVALDRRVAWDSVRGGLREDFKKVFAKSTLQAGLGALIGPTIINGAIDTVVSPQGITSLIRIGKAFPSSTFVHKEQDRFKWEQVKYAFFSGDPLTFRLDIAADGDKSGEGAVTTLFFKWAGDWKLCRIILPLDAIQNMASGSHLGFLSRP